jgi:large subunit ribosomal protein L31e
MKMAELTFNIPLRLEIMKAPKYKRAKKAVHAVREFIARRMKTDKVLIGKYINLKLWENGIKNPPHHIAVVVTKDDKGVVRAELVGAPKEAKKEEKAKKKEAPSTATPDAPAAAPSPEKKEEPKPAEKKPAAKKVVKKEAVKPTA